MATPLEWKELKGNFRPRKYKLKNIFRRITQKKNPWEDIDRIFVTLDIADELPDSNEV